MARAIRCSTARGAGFTRPCNTIDDTTLLAFVGGLPTDGRTNHERIIKQGKMILNETYVMHIRCDDYYIGIQLYTKDRSDAPRSASREGWLFCKSKGEALCPPHFKCTEIKRARSRGNVARENDES